MSKSSMIVMTILLVAFGSMLIAADLIVGPLEKDLGFARDIIADLDQREWLSADKPKPDDRVRVRTVRGGGDGRMSASEEWGVIIEVRPAEDALVASRRIQHLVGIVMDHVEEHSQAERRLHWVELVLFRDQDEIFRTLIERDSKGGWLAPEPQIPASWAPEGAPRPVKPTRKRDG